MKEWGFGGLAPEGKVFEYAKTPRDEFKFF